MQGLHRAQFAHTDTGLNPFSRLGQQHKKAAPPLRQCREAGLPVCRPGIAPYGRKAFHGTSRWAALPLGPGLTVDSYFAHFTWPSA